MYPFKNIYGSISLVVKQTINLKERRVSRCKKATKDEVLQIKSRFLAHYPDSVTELKYKNLYELLVSVMLSAQCTDKRVNIITPKLFEQYPDVNSLAGANLDELKQIIKSCSFFNNKAKNLIKMAEGVMSEFGGMIPLVQKDLVKLSGVGQKTANVVLIEYAGENLMAVDTHVYRVSRRLGLCSSATAVKCENELEKAFVTDLHKLHQAMVLFGRYSCKAIKPLCDGCFLSDLCKCKKVPKPK